MIAAVNRLLSLEKLYIRDLQLPDEVIDQTLNLDHADLEEIQNLNASMNMLIHMKEKRNMMQASDYALYERVRKQIQKMEKTAKSTALLPENGVLDVRF